MDPNDKMDPFEEFAAAGEVEVGDSQTEAQEEKPAKPAAKRGPPKEAAPVEADDEDQPDEEGDEEGDDEENDDEENDDGKEKPKKSSKDFQIERLKREKAEMARRLREIERSGGVPQELLQRLENLEKGLSPQNRGGNSSTEKAAPDPSDTDKYPLGHLDDRYIEDRLEWLAEKKAAERADAVLQRQQEIEQETAQQEMVQALLEKVDDLSTRGSDLFDDFQESVVEAGMRGDWDLDQPTFEAAHEAEHGAQILYELANNPKEASRVAKLSPYQQLKFVQERDAEIGKGKSARRIPRAGEPPKNAARGANSRTTINPATDNLDDFEKAWEADARKSMR